MNTATRPFRAGIFAALFAALPPLVLGGAAPASANDLPDLFLQIEVEREQVRVDEQGRRVVERVPVEMASRGDVLVYTLKAENRGSAPASNARIEDPIPQGTQLLVNSFPVGSRPTDASLDGGRNWQSFPARVAVVGADGQKRLVPAPATAYTHLRWVLDGPLEPGQSKGVSFKVRVD